MAGYTKLDIAEVRGILELYDLRPENIELQALNDGISNSNYRLTIDERELLFKVSNAKTADELADEHRLVNWLSHHHFPYVVAPYETNEGKTVYEYKQYCGALFPFVKSESSQISPESLHLAGKALAELHNISIGKQNLKLESLRSYKNVGYGIKQIAAYAEEERCPLDFREAFQFLFPQDKLENLFDLDLPGGIIHGDFYFDNALFYNSKLVAMLDFEQAGVGRFILDLGIAISGSALRDGELSADLIQAYVKGYESIRSLEDGEKALLNDAILVGLLSISLWRIKRFTEGSIDESKKDSYKELLERALMFKKNIED